MSSKKEIDKNCIEQFIKTIKNKDFHNYINSDNLSEKELHEAIECAIYLAYLDACRTFRYNPKDGKREKFEKKSDDIIDLANIIYNYIFCNGEFVHHKVCLSLIDKYGMTYGQAQKIINMTFKYIFCIKNFREKEEKFEKCHMPLDSIMLEWIVRNIEGIEKKRVGTWSSMKHKKDVQSEENYTYEDYIKVIETYCRENSTYPLKIDFENWNKMKLVLSAEEFILSFKSEIKRRDLKEKTFDGLISEIENIIQMCKKGAL